MNKLSKFLLLFLTGVMLAGTAVAQTKTKAQLEAEKAKREAERKKKQQEISYTKRILKETTNKRGKSLAVLQTLNKQIANRKELIDAFKGEIDVIDAEIDIRQGWIDTLEIELDMLKKEYAQMIYNGYKSKNQFTTITMIFSSSTFNQALRRIKYLQAITNHRKKQVELISEKKTDIQHNIDELELSKQDKSSLIVMQEGERVKLERDKGRENDIYADLKSKERKLKKDLRAKQAAADRLDKQIKKIIKEIIALETTGITELAKSFAANKGRLPWPVTKGYISSTFGRHPHPTISGVMVENNGIDITTTKGTKAICIFEGTVSAIVSMPGMGKTVLVKHGKYFSVYSNLSEVYVSKGDKVKIKQEIGLIDTNDEGKTSLHFELWDGTNKQNPASWILKK